MRALVWHGTTDMRWDTVPDPRIEDDHDAIGKVTSCAICGSDLHLYDHFMPGMEKGSRRGARQKMTEIHNLSDEGGLKRHLRFGRQAVNFELVKKVSLHPTSHRDEMTQLTTTRQGLR